MKLGKIIGIAVVAVAGLCSFGPGAGAATSSIACVVAAGLCTGIAGASTAVGDTIVAANYYDVPGTPPATTGGGGQYQDIGTCDSG
ncbi:MAG TPA: hypothetical protein VGF97_11785, partial [Rhizomicrobium sp.]